MQTKQFDRQTRYVSVDIVKGIAMIMVILVHYGLQYRIGIAKVFQYFQMGCPMFFVASGFGIMCLINKRYKGELNKENIGQFYFSRFKALAPGWYIAFVFIFLVNTILLYFTGKTLSFGTNRGLLSIICNLLFLNGLLPFCNNNVMPGGWYIGTTVILYVLTPLIQKGLIRTRNKRIFFVISSFMGMLLWGALYFAFPDSFANSVFGYFFFLVHYPEYLLGIMLYYDLSNNLLQKTQINRCLLCGIGSLIIAVVLFYSGLPWGFIPSAWMTALATYFILHYLISNERMGEKKVICKVFENFGKNSYCIFLLHAFLAWPFVRLSLKLLAKIGISQTISFFALIPITLFLSYVVGLIFRGIVKKATSIIFQRRTA